MAMAAETFRQRIARLKADLVEQSVRVQRMVEAAIEGVFEADLDKGHWVRDHDDVIDRADVEIERASVALLTDVAAVSCELDPSDLRWILTIVKVNNELERIADEAVHISERIETFKAVGPPPDRYRVMANSVIGILENVSNAFEGDDLELARVVLASFDAVDQFERAIIREMQQGLVDKSVEVDFTVAVHAVTSSLERIDDHCTNIAEQIIYVATGKIVRHAGGHWTEPHSPDQKGTPRGGSRA